MDDTKEYTEGSLMKTMADISGKVGEVISAQKAHGTQLDKLEKKVDSRFDVLEKTVKEHIVGEAYTKGNDDMFKKVFLSVTIPLITLLGGTAILYFIKLTFLGG